MPSQTAVCCEISHTEAVEDCLRTIFKLAGRKVPVTTSGLAEQLRVAPPTVSAMLKRLEAGELLTRSAHEIRLTGHGERHARGVTRRHRLVETFLVEVLGLNWDEVHEEADILEHALSERLEDRIDAYLGHPTHDPHGDPIPPRKGRHVESWAAPLSGATAGSRFRVERVADDDSAALRYLAERGITPGVVLEVMEREPFGGPLWVKAGAERYALPPLLTDLVHGGAV
ncbi:metal-dependent transcriptional regulator [Kribbella sp. CA-293567]|uniref:metal-dependent transcriptional regulator n=1 Tax=Kribbella sp. CA-293567 TaxID=3002436 RepID=UPI0022DD448C|nr:metal-dependent transcriptional regulator [Kribbella sp. CA-293567]WBQ02088.1 metal-dependent transcriptional regulator [Kribbella sp. CA-293567]